MRINWFKLLLGAGAAGAAVVAVKMATEKPTPAPHPLAAYIPANVPPPPVPWQPAQSAYDGPGLVPAEEPLGPLSGTVPVYWA